MTTELVRIFKCPCEGNKYKLVGEPKSNPTLQEKREYGDYIAAGCTVLTIPIEQFREENWKWCDKHFESKKSKPKKNKEYGIRVDINTVPPEYDPNFSEGLPLNTIDEIVDACEGGKLWEVIDTLTKFLIYKEHIIEVILSANPELKDKKRSDIVKSSLVLHEEEKDYDLIASFYVEGQEKPMRYFVKVTIPEIQ